MWWLLACLETTTQELASCEVALSTAEPAAAEVGAEVVLSASPLTEDFDTAVLVGGVRAEVLSLTRTGCESCDICVNANECSECSADCDACDSECDTNCAESLVFVVPELAAGATTIELFNTHGGSERLAFEVVAAPDTGSTDTGG